VDTLLRWTRYLDREGDSGVVCDGVLVPQAPPLQREDNHDPHEEEDDETGRHRVGSLRPGTAVRPSRAIARRNMLLSGSRPSAPSRPCAAVVAEIKTLRCTPAMEAGLTKRLWTVRDIAELLEREEQSWRGAA
jgi:hypothetical protein